MESTAHQDEVTSQFTRQARPFADHAAHSERRSLEIFQEFGKFSGIERVLDAGCGPGLVSCFLAPLAAEVEGVDLTPAMIDISRERARKLGIANARFTAGNMTALPFDDATFDAAVTRYTFHHLENPARAFGEMARVVRPGGLVIVMDATPEAAKRAAYDAFERRRDPSHTRALTGDEFTRLGDVFDLEKPSVVHFGLEMVASALIDSSFPETTSRAALVESLSDDIGKDELSFQSRREDGELRVTFPLTAGCWVIPLERESGWAKGRLG